MKADAPKFTILAVSDKFLSLVKKDRQELLNKGLFEVFPSSRLEVSEHYSVETSFNHVIQTGKPDELPLSKYEIFSAPNQVKTCYWFTRNEPVLDGNGRVAYIVNLTAETEQIKQRKALKEAQDREQALYEELAATNAELISINEDMRVKNEELITANDELQRAQFLHQQALLLAQESESRFRSMVESAPVAIMVFTGKEMKVDLANAAMLNILRRENDIIGKPLLVAMPELCGQSATELLFNVLHTGQPAFGSETALKMRRNGMEEICYFNFTYHPLVENGQIIGVMDVAFEVTDQVKARHQLEDILSEKTALAETLRQSEQRLQSILDTMAEGVGIIDIKGQLVYANSMAQRLLGLTESEIKERTYNDAKWQNLRIDGTFLPDEEHPMSIMMRTGVAVYDREIAVQPTEGERFYISINAAPIRDDNGNLTGGIGTFMDVTNRRKLIMQKDDFIGVASHELKTPVTSLKASLQLLARLKEDSSPEQFRKLVAQATKSLDKLSGLIGELLNTNRITEGQLQLRKTTFNLADMIDNSCDHIRAAGTHKLILKGELDVDVYADETQVEQVLVNFVNNAVKYAPESKEVIISIESSGKTVKVSVTDYGQGISPEKKQHLFERYYRADYSGVQFSGLGLGLYISSEIIKKHRGKVGVESELGKGSTFWFTLPLDL